MRTIKFRGKDLNGTWVYGYYTQGGFVLPDGTSIVRHLIHGDSLYDVDPKTVSQFTGLLDKNGKEIYEGDIIASRNYSEARHYVRYMESEASFVAVIIGSAIEEYCSIRQAWIDKCGKEVIANIHDNLGLIKH